MQFSDFGPRKVIAAFDGGEITSDAGVLLLRQCERRLRLSSRMAACFEDHRDGARVRHSLADLLNPGSITGIFNKSNISFNMSVLRRIQGASKFTGCFW